MLIAWSHSTHGLVKVHITHWWAPSWRNFLPCRESPWWLQTTVWLSKDILDYFWGWRLSDLLGLLCAFISPQFKCSKLMAQNGTGRIKIWKWSYGKLNNLKNVIPLLPCWTNSWSMEVSMFTIVCSLVAEILTSEFIWIQVVANLGAVHYADSKPGLKLCNSST